MVLSKREVLLKSLEKCINKNDPSELIPAFRDNRNGAIYLSKHNDGTVASLHVIECLPREMVLRRTKEDRPVQLHGFVEIGYVQGEIFIPQSNQN